MKHYVCVGECGSVSDYPGTCDSSDCSQNNQSRLSCDCHNGYHEAVFEEGDRETDPEE